MSHRSDDTGRRRLGATGMGWLFVALMAAMPTARATTFTVTSTADSSGTTCAATCTLRQAINAANAAAGADTINFNIGGGGVHTIMPASNLPLITSPVTINGYSQPGSAVNTAAVGSNAVLLIEINGASSSGSIGIGLASNSNPSTIRGLVINGVKTVSGSGGFGIEFFALSNVGGAVRGCFIGTDAAGAAAKANGRSAVFVAGADSGVTIGGTALADRNLIAGNGSHGINLATTGNVVQGNLIGVAADGVSLIGNGFSGVLVQAPLNSIGGTSAAAANVIAGNQASGILVNNNASGATIEGNAIHDNGSIGIDLSTSSSGLGDGVTFNDADDADAGGNNLQNFPVLTGAGLSGGSLFVQGTLDSTPNRSFRIEYFMSDVADPSGYGEGQKYIGSQTLSTNAGGHLSFLASGGVAGAATRKIITATATDTVTGDTSEFSTGTAIVSDTTVTNTNDSGDGSLRQAILNSNSHIGPDVIDFAIPGIGVHMIALQNVLPTITDTVTIDGYTQLGAAANTLVEGDDAAILIQLDGASLAGSGIRHGLALCASNSTVRGLSIGRFPGSAVAVGVQNNSTACAAAPSGVAVEGNFLGLAPDGTTARANSVGGVAVRASSTRIGGASPAQRNLISANAPFGTSDGIFVVQGSNATTIDGNYIGTDASGRLDRGNTGFGIRLSIPTSGAVIGGTAPNLIAYNVAGIEVFNGSASNKFFANAIHDNDVVGIDLCAVAVSGCPDGSTPNDIDDADTGSNNLQNFPVITALSRTATGLLISGSLDRPATASSLTFAIGVYANTVCDLSGFGEGERYLGSFNFVSANSGVQTFTNTAFPTTAALPSGTKITMTATDPAGNTSEFSQCAELDAGAQTFVVNSTLDIDDENCTVAVDGCTLREAISAANGRVGADFIAFNIPGGGVHVISPTSALPTVTDAVTIDGYTQPGTSANTLGDGDNAVILIRVDGANLSSPVELVSICAANSLVRGLSLTAAPHEAITFGHNASGQLCATGSASGSKLTGSFVGIAPDGSVHPNQQGATVVGSRVTVGGTGAAERNVLSGSEFDGVVIINPGVNGSIVAGNLIGWTPGGAAAGNNRFGVLLGVSAKGVTVGQEGSPNKIGHNGVGIYVNGVASGNRLFANDVSLNAGLGIDLIPLATSDGATPNDADDGDDGGNDLQNFPVLASAVQDGPNLHIVGTLDVPAGATSNNYALAFYANASCSDRGQGEMYLGYVNVELSGASQQFDAQLLATAPLGSSISSTATSAGGTSEFSTCVTLTAGDHIFANGFD